MIRRPKLLFVFIVVFLIILLSLPLSFSQKIKFQIIDFLSPAIKLSNHLFQKIFIAKDLLLAFQENEQLRKELDGLSNGIDRDYKIYEENKRLRELLKLKEEIPYKTIVCQVIARDTNTWYKTLIINKGEEDSIKQNMPVIAARGVVGRVMSCGSNSSRVLLITDVNSSIGGLVQTNRTVGLVNGQGNDTCIFDLIPKKSEISKGDRIVTSGFGQIFPKGLLIGTVNEISIDNQNLYKFAKLKLAVDVDSLEEVLVLTDSN